MGTSQSQVRRVGTRRPRARDKTTPRPLYELPGLFWVRCRVPWSLGEVTDLRSIHGSEVRTGQARALGRPGSTRGDGASLHAQRRGTISRPRTHRALVAHQLAPSSRPRGADQPRLGLTSKTSKQTGHTGRQPDRFPGLERARSVAWSGVEIARCRGDLPRDPIPIQQIGDRPGHGQSWLDMAIFKLSMTIRWFDCPILTPDRWRIGITRTLRAPGEARGMPHRQCDKLQCLSVNRFYRPATSHFRIQVLLPSSAAQFPLAISLGSRELVRRWDCRQGSVTVQQSSKSAAHFSECCQSPVYRQTSWAFSPLSSAGYPGICSTVYGTVTAR